MQVIIALVIALGVFMIAADSFHIPYLRTSMAMDRLARRQKEKTSQMDIWLKGLAVWIAGKLRLNEYRKAQLASDLRSAGIPLTPEMHIANSLVQSLLVGAGSIPFLFFMPFISAVLVGSAVFLYFYNARGVAEKIREKRRQIEFELPRFVAHIDKTLKHNRDVLAIIDSYKENAGDAMKSELEITAADMRSGNYEAALTRLESRVGSSMLSDTTRGLIGVLRGDDGPDSGLGDLVDRNADGHVGHIDVDDVVKNRNIVDNPLPDVLDDADTLQRINNMFADFEPGLVFRIHKFIIPHKKGLNKQRL